jgi:carbonic anhydrase/acetyltransferase-like protein (isoleucine patch superfamily)
MSIVRAFAGTHPDIAADVFLADDAVIIGDVVIGAGSSLWYQTVVRGDVNRIRIGERVNVQDGTVIHVVRRTGPTHIADDVTIGHRAVVHGCTLGRGALVGIGAQVLDLAEVGPEAMVGAGAVVAPRARIPARHLALGVPARVVRPLTEQELAYNRETAENYQRLAAQHEADRR